MINNLFIKNDKIFEYSIIQIIRLFEHQNIYHA